MPDISALGPIDPTSIANYELREEEKAAPWIVRKLVGVSCLFISYVALAFYFLVFCMF